MNFRRGSGRDEPEINLIPFIDVLLVIIIFLMMTTTYNKVSGIEINLPTASSNNATPPNEITVAVTSSGSVMIDSQSMNHPSVSQLAAALKTAATKKDPSERQPVVSINADGAASHQSVVDVMQAAQDAGLSQISFTTRRGS